MVTMQDFSLAPAVVRAWRSPVRLNQWLVHAAVVVALSLIALAGGWTHRTGWAPVAILMITVPLAGRRRWPLTCFAVQLVGIAVIGRISSAPPVILLAIAIGGFTATAVSGRWPRVLAGVGMAGIAVLIHLWTGSGSSVMLLLTIWLLVCAVRSLWLRSQSAEKFALALRREQEARGALALKTERARIARELHDVIGHNVSVMMIQAGAARHAVSDRPEVNTALLEVEGAGRQTMTELRRMLELLGSESGTGDGDADEDLSPQLGLAHVEPLVARVRAAGLPVQLSTEGAARPLEPGVDLAAYRVVQEGLTNALKYAGGSPTEATIAYRADGLSVAIRDDGGPIQVEGRDGSGRGLLGLRERVALYHGRFEAGRQRDGGYRIAAFFPFETP
jgi:signal transduction histidine kinase